MTLLVGISGPISSGKTTFARMLSDALGDQCSILHNADILKEACAYAFALPVNLFHDVVLKEQPFVGDPPTYAPVVVYSSDIGLLREFYAERGIDFTEEHSQSIRNSWLGFEFKTPRHLLQIVGTDMLRMVVDQDIHVKAHAAEAAKLQPSGIVLVPDVRFVNEQDVVDYSVYVVNNDREPKDVTKLHYSEQALPQLRANADFQVLNEEGLDVLKVRAEKLAAFLQQKL